MNELFIELVEAIAHKQRDEATALFRQFIKQAEFPFESSYVDGYRVLKIDDFTLLVFRYMPYEPTTLLVWTIDGEGFVEYLDYLEAFIARCFDTAPRAMGSIFYEGKFIKDMYQFFPYSPLQE